MLWFDVESRYKATTSSRSWANAWLWLDVESRYKVTNGRAMTDPLLLWFDVESRCKATCKVPAEFTVML